MRPLRILALTLSIGSWFLTSPHAEAQEVTLQVTPEGSTQGRDVDFGSVRSFAPSGQSQSSTVVRRIRLDITANNLSGRYRVYLRPDGPWVNPLGAAIPWQSVRFSVTESSSKGDVRLPNPLPVRGEEEVYVSSNPGESTELILNCVVEIPEGQQAGGYRMPVAVRVVAE